MSESATVSFARPVTAASGIYAPGHLGELTQYLPFELVDDLLSQTRSVQRRLRVLPSRVGVYLLVALGCFPAWDTAGVGEADRAVWPGWRWPCPSEKALRDLRRRLGPAPFKALFEVVAGPLAQPHTPGVRFRGLRTVAFDGCSSIKVPDTDRNRHWLGHIRYRMGFAGYPTLRLMTLVETGTRGMLGATLGSADDRDEATQARRLLPLLGPDMLLLLDRGFDGGAFFAEVAGTGAALLARIRSHRNPPVLAQLPDGSYLSNLDGLQVRIIEADLTVTGVDGSRVRQRYRLVTTLLDHHRFPAEDLIDLYHERWEIESAYLALRHTLLDGHVLRSGDRPGLEQEIWALLTLYQLLRMAMVAAVETRPGTNPDRASFTTAREAAREELTAARGISAPADPPTCPASSAGPSWPRCCHRADAATAPEGQDTPPPATSTATTDGPPANHHRRHRHHPAHAQRRPDMATPPSQAPRPAPGPDPTRHHHRAHGRRPEPTLARPRARRQAGIKPRNMLTQLAEWTRLGFLTRAQAGTYQLTTRRDTASP